MRATLDQQVYALRQWLRSETSLIELWARVPEVRESIVALREEAENAEDPHRQLSSSTNRLRLRQIIQKLSGQQGDNVRYAAWSREGMLIADSEDPAEFLGNLTTPYGSSVLSRPLGGENTIWFPTSDGYITKGYTPPPDATRELAVIVPVYATNQDTRPVGCLLVTEIGLEDKFEQLFKEARFLETGEFYAVDGNGYLMTESRFIEQLQDAG